MGQALESWDPRLSAALTELALGPTGERHRRVAAEYRRLGVLDMAYAHLSAAVRLDEHDVAAYDGLARIWRDWGTPYLGFGDAERAVELAPRSPVAANTLGTLLQATGRLADARRWYERALGFDAGATYALNNVCYTGVLLRRSDAVSTCERAAAVAPDSSVARNNLAVALAAAGNFAKAREVLAASGSPAEALYNMGILYMSARHYSEATGAFDAALRENPGLAQAAARARQSRRSAAQEIDQ
jgi:superkiller protein 3